MDQLLRERSWLRGLSASLVGPGDADDLAQDAWLALLERERRGGEGAVPDHRRGWLAGTARTLAMANRRKRASRLGHEHMYAGDFAGKDAKAAAVDELAEQAELQSEVVALLLNLKEPIRGTLLLRYQGDLTAAEIARQSGEPAGTVRRRLKEGLDQLRARMDAKHGDRNAWAPALVGVAPAALKASLVSSGSTLASGATLLGMKQLMWLMAAALLVGASWIVSSELQSEPSAPQVLAVSQESEPHEVRTNPAVLSAPASPEGDVRELLGEQESQPIAVSPSFSVLDEAGTSIPVTAMFAVIDEQKHALESAANGAFTLGDDAAELVDGRTSVPIVVSRAGSWPHTFDAPLRQEHHALVWPEGVMLRGRLLERGQRPGATIRLTLKRDVGWSGRPHAALIDDQFDPIPRSVTADEDGRFVLSDLPVDWRGWLSIEKAWRFDDGLRQSPAVDAKGPGSFDLDIERSPRIVGRVLDRDTGEPVVGQTVGLMEDRASQSSNFHGAETDSNGRFIWFPDARATSVEFRFGMANDYRSKVLQNVVPPVAGTLDLGEVTLEKTLSALLRIVDQDGIPVQGAEVRENGAHDPNVSASDGTVLVPVESLEATSVDIRAAGFEHATFEIVALSKDAETVVELRPELRFSLRVQGPGGNPLPDCQVAFVAGGVYAGNGTVFGNHYPEPSVGTVSGFTSYVNGPEVFRFSTNEDGFIGMAGLPFNMSIQCGFMDRQGWIDAPLTISAGVDGSWTGTLYDRRERLPKVHGIVTTLEGAPITDANVKFPSALMASYARTDENGAFTAPVQWRDGRSYLLVTAPGFARLRHPLRLETLGPDPLRLTLDESRPLTVRVVGADGSPVQEGGLSVAVRGNDNRWNHLGAETPDSEGRCSFTGLAPTDLQLTMTRDGYRQKVIISRDTTEYTFHVAEHARIVVDWSALAQKGAVPDAVFLRKPRLEGEGVFQRLAEDEVESYALTGKATVTSTTSFACAPGEYEILALTGDSKATAKVVATERITVVAGADLRVELRGAN